MMTKKMLIFGASGFVGRHIFQNAIEQGFEVSGFSQAGADKRFLPLDISDPEAVGQAVSRFGRGVVINTAAISNIDKAETDKESAWRVNVDGALNIAKACKAYNCRYLFFSSDAVFSGNESSYKETDPTCPVNYYGYTKAEAEKAILAALPSAIIIRVSLVLGFPIEKGNSFLNVFDSNLKAGKPVELSTDEIRTPIDVRTLASCCLELAVGGFEGILHLASTDAMSRFEMGRLYAKKAGYDESLVIPSATRPLGQAQRHRRGVLKIDKAMHCLNTPLGSVEDYIERILKS